MKNPLPIDKAACSNKGNISTHFHSNREVATLASPGRIYATATAQQDGLPRMGG
jgi:hypothetical protein